MASDPTQFRDVPQSTKLRFDRACIKTKGWTLQEGYLSQPEYCSNPLVMASCLASKDIVIGTWQSQHAPLLARLMGINFAH